MLLCLSYLEYYDPVTVIMLAFIITGAMTVRMKFIFYS